MGLIKTLMKAISIGAHKSPADQEPVINPTERQKLERAKARADRLERIVIAYTGAELSALTGKDTD